MRLLSYSIDAEIGVVAFRFMQRLESYLSLIEA
jgi:hypothetical protein